MHLSAPRNRVFWDRLYSIGYLLPVQAKYELKVQAIRSKAQQPRLYVYFPIPLAAAIGMEAGEQVQWELLDRGELHLVRQHVPPPESRRRVRQG